MNFFFCIKEKNVINIDHTQNNVILDPQLLTRLTQYVCFMEGQQNLDFDKNAKVMSQDNQKQGQQH